MLSPLRLRSAAALSTLHDLTAGSHVGRTERARLASLLAQGARLAEPVQAEVANSRAVDVLGVADIGAHTALATEADARAADVEQRVTKARAASRLSNLARRVARTEERDDADGKVAETAAQVVLERCHPVDLHINSNYALQVFACGRSVCTCDKRPRHEGWHCWRCYYGGRYPYRRSWPCCLFS